jgi:hypothetical protein
LTSTASTPTSAAQITSAARPALPLPSRALTERWSTRWRLEAAQAALVQDASAIPPAPLARPGAVDRPQRVGRLEHVEAAGEPQADQLLVARGHHDRRLKVRRTRDRPHPSTSACTVAQAALAAGSDATAHPPPPPPPGPSFPGPSESRSPGTQAGRPLAGRQGPGVHRASLSGLWTTHLSPADRDLSWRGTQSSESAADDSCPTVPVTPAVAAGRTMAQRLAARHRMTRTARAKGADTRGVGFRPGSLCSDTIDD